MGIMMMMLRGEVIMDPIEKMTLDLSCHLDFGINLQQEHDMIKEVTTRTWGARATSRRLVSRFPRLHEARVDRRELRGRGMR